jgi:hypothetical protein
METRTVLTEREGWRTALESGDIDCAFWTGRRPPLSGDLAVIFGAAGTSASRTAGMVNLLEMRYGWVPLPDNSLLLADTRDLPSFDNTVPRSSFVPFGFDPDLYRAWEAHPQTFKEQRGAVHGNGWHPVVDSAGSRLISASANAVGYQAADILLEEFVSRRAHLLSRVSASGTSGGPRELAVVTIEWPGGTSTGVSPHLLAAARRACADDHGVTLHPIRFLVLPTETAEEAVRVNAQQAMIEVALQGCQAGDAEGGGTVICVSPQGPERIVDPALLEERAAHLVWTIGSGSTGVLPALLAELANVEAVSTRDQRGLARSLAFAGVGVVDANLFELSQELTLELVVRVGEHLYGRVSSVIGDGTAGALIAADDGDGQRQLVVAGPSVAASPVYAPRDRPEARSDAATSPAVRRRPGPRPGERARELARELAAVPMIGVEWSLFAATGMTRAEERRLRRDYVDGLEQEYRPDVRARLKSVLPGFVAPYRDPVVEALNSGGIPAALDELARSRRALEAEIAALPRPVIKVGADRLERREKELYKGRSLRARMNLLQDYLDGLSRSVRYRAILLALRTIKKELASLGERLRQHALDAQPILARAEAMMSTLRRSRRERWDAHVVAVLNDEPGAARLREIIGGDLLDIAPDELVARIWVGEGDAIARRIEEQTPAQVLADMAARVSKDIGHRARSVSIGDLVLEFYEDGPERLRSAIRGAITRSLAAGGYGKERNGKGVTRLIFVAHHGSDSVQHVISEVLRQEGCLSDLRERPASTSSPAIHFVTVETGISPACVIPACKGGSWFEPWFERQKAFESGLAANPSARDSLVLEATRRHKLLKRLDASYVEEDGSGRRRSPPRMRTKVRRPRSPSSVERKQRAPQQSAGSVR